MTTTSARRSTRVRTVNPTRVPTLTPDRSDRESTDFAPSPPPRRASHNKKNRSHPRHPHHPSAGDGSSHRGQKVSRSTQLRRNSACLSCRRRRTKCDAVKPQCGACVRHQRFLARQMGEGAAIAECACVYEEAGSEGSEARRGSGASQASTVEHEGVLDWRRQTALKSGGDSAPPRATSQTSASSQAATPPPPVFSLGMGAASLGGQERTRDLGGWRLPHTVDKFDETAFGLCYNPPPHLILPPAVYGRASWHCPNLPDLGAPFLPSTYSPAPTAPLFQTEAGDDPFIYINHLDSSFFASQAYPAPSPLFQAPLQSWPVDTTARCPSASISPASLHPGIAKPAWSGWEDGRLRDGMMTTGIAPGPLSPEQLLLVMQMMSQAV